MTRRSWLGTRSFSLDIALAISGALAAKWLAAWIGFSHVYLLAALIVVTGILMGTRRLRLFRFARRRSS